MATFRPVWTGECLGGYGLAIRPNIRMPSAPQIQPWRNRYTSPVRYWRGLWGLQDGLVVQALLGRAPIAAPVANYQSLPSVGAVWPSQVGAWKP